jgi:CDGSH-type Zn-finger protein
MNETEGIAHSMKIQVDEDGPYLVSGSVPIIEVSLIPDELGLSVGYKETRRYPIQAEVELCRCGQSSDGPFCDNTHRLEEFDGTETASRAPFMDQAEPKTQGPELTLIDVVKLCASARFCDRSGGAWDNTRASDDPAAKAIAEEIVWNCPAGRLALLNKEGNLHEPDLKPEIWVIEDPLIDGMGPLWVRGRIPIEGADGELYEIRNRVTLCRCGKSTNKPFCDGSHCNH